MFACGKIRTTNYIKLTVFVRYNCEMKYLNKKKVEENTLSTFTNTTCCHDGEERVAKYIREDYVGKCIYKRNKERTTLSTFANTVSPILSYFFAAAMVRKRRGRKGGG